MQDNLGWFNKNAKWPVQKCNAKAQKTKKYSPQTSCKKVPREVCGAGSIAVPQGEECFDRQETVIQEVRFQYYHEERAFKWQIIHQLINKWNVSY